ncbi:hypothetical protein SAMN03003324_00901 [Pedobacter antarcticus]|nr:hypothetical protein SAMN03003324_00901 [Pedobacter antarcticus]
MNINGKKLKMAIKSLDMTQEEAAIKLNTSRQSLSQWFKYEVLSNDILQNVKTNLNIDLNVGDSFRDTLNPSINSDRKGVPYYDIDFVGGFDLVFNGGQVNPAFYIDFLPFNDADYWVNVSGNSMGPLIAHGDLVALKKVDSWQEFLLEGEIYAVITNNGFRTIKMIGAGKDDEHYMLIPYNKGADYANQSIPKKVITHVFRVKGAIKKFF